MKKKLIIAFGFLFAFVVLYSAYYLNTASSATDHALEYLKSSEMVQVDNAAVIRFEPKVPNGKGVVFYPGGKVKPEAYAPMCFKLSEKGYLVVIEKMPFNLAVFDINAAKNTIDREKQVSEWYIGGHSLGGAMASSYVKKHPETVKGIFFLAAYPVESTDLASLPIKSLSIYGEKDGLVDLAEIPNHSKLLPQNHVIEIIAGGNHAQFGDYGLQNGDGTATIDNEDQLSQVVNLLLDFMK